MQQFTLTELNHMDQQTFVRKLGWIFEHSPWVADEAYRKGPFSSLDDLHLSMVNVVKKADDQAKLGLLKAHPDLATKAKVTSASQQEQARAGLDQLSETEYEEFLRLNKTYSRKFGFPFILAVKGKDKQAIQRSMSERLNNGLEEERKRALQEVYKIARFRLEQTIDRQEGIQQ